MSAPSKDALGVGLTGTGWVADVHARAFALVPDAHVVGVVSRDRARGDTFAKKHGVDKVFADIDQMLADPSIDVVVVGLPNHLHAPVVLAAAAAKKHVICEKPLAVNLEEAEQMVAACKKAGVMLAIAEELCFAPRFVHVKSVAESGALGRIFQVSQREQHGGPYSPWFFTREEAGGGALMDMGVHSIEVTRWLLGRPRAKAVYARMANHTHAEKTELEDHATMIVEFEGNVTAVLEPSWSLQGGMESHLNVFGTEGVLYTDLLRETGMRMFSQKGHRGDADSVGWSRPDHDWLGANGYPQEMAHFIQCARTGARPLVSGEDGIAELEIMYAAYESAATGARVELPFRPKGVERAVDLWLRRSRK